MSIATATLVTTPLPGTTVWCITKDKGIKSGKLIKVSGTSIITKTTYDFEVDFPTEGGIMIFSAEDIFTTLHEAVLEYEIRLT